MPDHEAVNAELAAADQAIDDDISAAVKADAANSASLDSLEDAEAALIASVEALEAARQALERVQLLDLADRYPDNLSGGEQQRVAIARAFVGPRTILLADEPTGALDSVTGELVMRLMRAECDRGRTTLLVTHDAAHAGWADRVLFLRDGEIVDETRDPT